MKVARRVVGIDAGYVNFAVCAIDADNFHRPFYWKNSALFKGEFSQKKLRQAIFNWLETDEVKGLLDGADQIVLEEQMVMKFQAVNHFIMSRYFDKTITVWPKTHAAYFGLPQDRKEKKKAGVELVGRNAVLPIRKGKKDDLADSYLLAAYGHFCYNPKLKEGWVDVHNGGTDQAGGSGKGGRKAGRGDFDIDLGGGSDNKRARPNAAGGSVAAPGAVSGGRRIDFSAFEFSAGDSDSSFSSAIGF